MKSFFTEELQHSKWEEFRKLAKADTANEECSQLLRRMELQDSDNEEEELLQEVNTTDEVELEAAQFEENHGRRK